MIAIAAVVAFVILYGLIKGVKVYDAFIEGARKGFGVAIKILPYMAAIMLAAGVMRGSGAMEAIARALGPALSFIGLPAELTPLVIMRPISGSATLGLLADIMAQYGADSHIGRLASVIAGSSETVFYTVALYFGYVGIKRTRHTVPAALAATLGGIVASVWACSLFFG
ncbi:MAG: spore maturation protein [Christensenellales bacterium]|jgi:spore maturation protein B